MKPLSKSVFNLSAENKSCGEIPQPTNDFILTAAILQTNIN